TNRYHDTLHDSSNLLASERPLRLVCELCNRTAPPPVHTLSLHDALPISTVLHCRTDPRELAVRYQMTVDQVEGILDEARRLMFRSEEHTSELQSRENLVCRLLLEKKKTQRVCERCKRQAERADQALLAEG